MYFTVLQFSTDGVANTAFLITKQIPGIQMPPATLQSAVLQ